MGNKEDKKKKEKEQQEEALEQQAEDQQTENEETESEYDQLVRERDELRDKYQRSIAELKNYQKRVAGERQSLIERTVTDTIEQFLFPVIDDLDRAIEAANQHGYDNNDPLYSGLTMVHSRMLDMLKQRNIEPIEAEGSYFDPLYHQAVMEQPSTRYENGQVIQAISRGYTANGKTIRPARVIVARQQDRKQDQEDNDTSQKQNNDNETNEE